MANLLTPVPSKTYKTKQNAIKAVEKLYQKQDFSFLVMQSDDGRFYPVCIGNSAVEARTFQDFYTCN